MTHLNPQQQAALDAAERELVEAALGCSGNEPSLSCLLRAAEKYAVLCPALDVDVAALNFIFENPPCPEGARFVECETDDGKSVNAGEWSQRPDGLWQVRVVFQRQSAQPGSVDEIGKALRRLHLAIKGLSKFEGKITLFEASPSKSQAAFEAWNELAAAQKLAAETLDRPPIKLLFDADWCRQKIENDPDVETEAGNITPATPDKEARVKEEEEPRHQGFTTHEAVQVALDDGLDGYEWLRAWWSADLDDDDPQSAEYRAKLDRGVLPTAPTTAGEDS